MSSKFLYFAYGSNLLAHRIHVLNPNAMRVGIGKLKDYQLDFIDYSKIWKGPAATIVPLKGGVVWGAIWELEDMDGLDKQEGVHVNHYFAITVDVESSDGKILKCRSYRQTATAVEVPQMENLPENRRPTPAYLNTIIEGAKESKLPEEYLRFLKKIPNNGDNVQGDLGYIYKEGDSTHSKNVKKPE